MLPVGGVGGSGNIVPAVEVGKATVPVEKMTAVLNTAQYSNDVGQVAKKGGVDVRFGGASPTEAGHNLDITG